MKKKIQLIIQLIILFNLQYVISSAQTISPKATPAAGGNFTGGDNSLSWTMGETFNTTLQVGNILLTQGQQQPYILLKILNLKAFIEGFYMGGGQMQAVLYNNDPVIYAANACDSVTVELHGAASPYNLVATSMGLLMATC